MKNNVLFFWYSSCETSVEESLILINAIMVKHYKSFTPVDQAELPIFYHQYSGLCIWHDGIVSHLSLGDKRADV